MRRSMVLTLALALLVAFGARAAYAYTVDVYLDPGVSYEFGCGSTATFDYASQSDVIASCGDFGAHVVCWGVVDGSQAGDVVTVSCVDPGR